MIQSFFSVPNSADFVPDTTWFKKGSNEEITGSDDKFGIDPKYKGRKLEVRLQNLFFYYFLKVQMTVLIISLV